MDSSGIVDPEALGFLPSESLDTSDITGSASDGIPITGLGTSLVNLIPGGKEVLDFIGLFGAILPELKKALADAEGAHPAQQLLKFAGHLSKLNDVWRWIETGPQDDAAGVWDAFANLTIGSLYKAMLIGGLTLKPDTWDAQAQRGVTTVDTMLGFTILMRLLGGTINAMGKLPFGGRWTEAVGDTFSELSEEMGLTWAMGMQIDKAFESAVGVSIEEAIFKEKRPNAPDWPIVRMLLKQKLATDVDLRERLAAMGYSDDWIKKLENLIDTPLPVGDLQNLYMHDIFSREDVDKGLAAIGFNGSQRDALLKVYVDKAETEASRAYVDTARGLARSHLLSKDAYRAILTKENYPDKQIDDDIAALDLLDSTGRIQTSVSTIKAEYERGGHDAPAAITALQNVGYDATHATELVHSWDLPRVTHQHGLSQAKILSYMASGIIGPSDARTQLIDSGLKSDTADFLIAHPNAKAGVHVHALSPAFVETAYVDGVLQIEDLGPAFKRAGIPDADLQDYIEVAIYKKSHSKRTSNGALQLDRAQILSAYHWGIFDPSTAHNSLVSLGYSSADATILLEIEDHGVPGLQQQGTVFRSLADAIAFLQGLGFLITPPPDPRVAAAEAMLSAAGYSYTQGTYHPPITGPPLTQPPVPDPGIGP